MYKALPVHKVPLVLPVQTELMVRKVPLVLPVPPVQMVQTDKMVKTE